MVGAGVVNLRHRTECELMSESTKRQCQKTRSWPWRLYRRGDWPIWQSLDVWAGVFCCSGLIVDVVQVCRSQQLALRRQESGGRNQEAMPSKHAETDWKQTCNTRKGKQETQGRGKAETLTEVDIQNGPMTHFCTGTHQLGTHIRATYCCFLSLVKEMKMCF